MAAAKRLNNPMKRPEVAAIVAAKNRGEKRPDVSAWRIQAYADGRLKPVVQTLEQRAAASERMRAQNPMKRPEVVAKVMSTSKATGAYARSGELTRQFWVNNPEFRQRAVDRMRCKNPMFNAATKEKSLGKTRQHLSQSKLEAWFESVCREASVPIWYTGTGQFWVEARNPDFKIHGRKLLIEVTDGYNRTPSRRTLETYALPTIQHYEAHGFACLVMMLPARLAERNREKSLVIAAVRRYLLSGWSQVWSASESIGLSVKTA